MNSQFCASVFFVGLVGDLCSSRLKVTYLVIYGWVLSSDGQRPEEDVRVYRVFRVKCNLSSGYRVPYTGCIYMG